MSRTGIEWCDEVWNPVTGCTRVSKGCDFCYAFALHDQRHVAWKRGRWPDAPQQYHKPFSQVQLLPERLDDPLHWRRPRRVFVNSMSDLFHPNVPEEYIAQVFAVMSLASQHTFQVLTKRPERMRELLRRETFQYRVDEAVERIASEHGWDACITETDEWPLPNVWLGVSVENQEAADERIPCLLETPAAVRFLSCEPLVRYVNLAVSGLRAGKSLRDLHWVIVGGESGPHARYMSLDWVDEVLRQCRALDIAPFVKQLGTVWAREHNAHDKHGGDPSEWPEHLRIREFPIGERIGIGAGV